MRFLRLIVAGVLVLPACTEKQQKPMENLAHDQEIMRGASAAANEVVRSATDCEAARPLIPEAYRKLEEAEARVQAEASRQILQTLRTQVDRVAELCP